jgi:proteasome assembly chaperone (PAC2) family protein
VPGDPIRYTPEAEQTALRQPVALAAFGGWVDAGTGGTGAVRHLVVSHPSVKLADIDPEEFYSFTDTRPLVSIAAPGERAVHWPRAEFHAITTEHTRDLVLFVAPEPNLKWRTFASVMLDALQRFGVQQLVAIGSIFGAVPHRAEVRLTGWATEPHVRDSLLRQKVVFTNYEGPTGFVTVLLAEAEARGLPAAAIFGFAPNYIQGVPNPRVSHALLSAFAQLVGMPLDLVALDRAGRALTRQVDQLLLEQPQLREQVERMLSLMNLSEPSAEIAEPESGPAGEAESPSPGLQSLDPQAVVNYVEELLKQRPPDSGAPDGQ